MPNFLHAHHLDPIVNGKYYTSSAFRFHFQLPPSPLAIANRYTLRRHRVIINTKQPHNITSHHIRPWYNWPIIIILFPLTVYLSIIFIYWAKKKTEEKTTIITIIINRNVLKDDYLMGIIDMLFFWIKSNHIVFQLNLNGLVSGRRRKWVRSRWNYGLWVYSRLSALIGQINQFSHLPSPKLSTASLDERRIHSLLSFSTARGLSCLLSVVIM